MRNHPRREWLLDQIADGSPGAILLDGLDEAILGYGQRGTGDYIAVYDFDGIVDLLTRKGMDRGDALEHFDYNIQGTWAGEGTPVIVYQYDGGSVPVPGEPLPEPDGAQGLGILPPLLEGEPHG